MSLGANEYFTKPIQTSRVLSVAKALLNIES
jgi:DNA-binding response OmpR family regulator